MTTAPSSDVNTYQGDFGESWLEVVAAGADLLHGQPATKDLDKADVQLTWQGEHGGCWSPCVQAQVKTTVKLPVEEGHYLYDLDLPTYNVLRRTDHTVGRILVVIGLSDDGERVRLDTDGTLLIGVGAWISLAGHPPTENTTSVRVRLPVEHTLDGAGLQQMLVRHGVRRTTPVPPFEPWGEGR